MGKPKSEDTLEKKRERDRRRRANIKNDPELYRQFREKEQARYQKRKREKKALPISELPPQKQNIVRQRNREGFRAYYHRLKAKKFETVEEVESEPKITLPERNEQPQRENDPLTSCPALETSRYRLRWGGRGKRNRESKTTYSTDTRGSPNIFNSNISNEPLLSESSLTFKNSREITCSTPLPMTRMIKAFGNLEGSSDNVISENELANVRSTTSTPNTSCCGTSISSITSNSSVSTCYSESSKPKITPKKKINKEEMLVQAEQSEPQPGPSRIPCTQTSDNPAFSTTHQDPLSRARIEQCRFCGEFGKTCVHISKMPYLSNNKTTLAVNDNIVQLDFADDSLPQTVCKDCDKNLKEMYNFVQKVKAAQNNMIKVGAEIRENVENDYAEVETVVVKTEYDDSDENSEEENEEKSEIFDSVTVGETVFIKESVPQKRKGNTEKVIAKKPKKAIDTQKKSDNESAELILDIKEEVIETETNEDVNNTECYISDTGTDVKPNEVELAASALIYEMRRESNDGVS